MRVARPSFTVLISPFAMRPHRNVLPMPRRLAASSIRYRCGARSKVPPLVRGVPSTSVSTMADVEWSGWTIEGPVEHLRHQGQTLRTKCDMPRGRVFPQAMQLAVDLAAQHPLWDARAIPRELQLTPGLTPEQVPQAEITVKRWLELGLPAAGERDREATPGGTFTIDAVIEGRWSAAQMDGPAGPVLLEALATVIEETGGERAFLTSPEAESILHLSRVAPDAPAGDLYRVARAYLQRRRSGLPVDTLDELMAFAPWRDAGARYAAAIRSGAAHGAHRLVAGSEAVVDEATRTPRSVRVK